MDQFKSSLALIKEFAAKYFMKGGEDAKSFCEGLTKFASLWGELCAAGMTLVSGNNEISQVVLQHNVNVGAWYGGKGQAVLKTIVKTRQRLLKAQADFESLAQDLLKSVEQLSAVPEDMEQPFADLFQTKAPESFLSELNSETFDDIISAVAADHREHIKEMHDSFLQKNSQAYELKGDAADADHFHNLATWAEGFSWDPDTDDATAKFLELHLKASDTLLSKLPGKLAKSFASQVIQDPVICQTTVVMSEC